MTPNVEAQRYAQPSPIRPNPPLDRNTPYRNSSRRGEESVLAAFISRDVDDRFARDALVRVGLAGHGPFIAKAIAHLDPAARSFLDESATDGRGATSLLGRH
jgi:hypothetical protein